MTWQEEFRKQFIVTNYNVFGEPSGERIGYWVETHPEEIEEFIERLVNDVKA